MPSITRVFRKDQTLYVYFEVYDPSLDPDQKTPSLTADLQLMHGARKAFTSPACALEQAGDLAAGRRALQLSDSSRAAAARGVHFPSRRNR